MVHNLIELVGFKWSLKKLRGKLIYKFLDLGLLYIHVHMQKPSNIHNKNLVFLQLSETVFHFKYFHVFMKLKSFYANSHDIFPL